MAYTNLFPGHLPTATVLGNYSLHAVKNTFSLSSADTFNTCLNSDQERREQAGITRKSAASLCRGFHDIDFLEGSGFP